MKIAILTSGILPVPAVMGGAVETQIDFYLNYNNLHQIHDITVYSIWNKAIRNHPALNSSVNHYYYVKVNNLWAKFKKKLYHRLYGDGYYHYTIEFYFREAWKHLKKEQYDIILLDNRPGYAINIKLPKNVRLFYYLHNDLLNKNTDKAVMIYNAATRIITVSDYISNWRR